MRRELTIRCIAVGTVRTESPDGVRCELRDVSLEVNGGPAHVRIMVTWARGEHMRDCTIELDGLSVRSRSGRDVLPETAITRAPLDWLLAIAEAMEEGDHRKASVWVRSMDLAALLHATPADLGCSRTSKYDVKVEEQAAARKGPQRPSDLHLVPATL